MRKGAVIVVVLCLLVTGCGHYRMMEKKQYSFYEKEGNEPYGSCIPETARTYMESVGGQATEITEGEGQKTEKSEELRLYAKAAALIDGDSLRVLYGKDSDTRYPMASTTKIMTCLYTLEHGNLDDVVTVSSRAASQPKVHLGMREGQQYRLQDLLYSLMLESHNDSAVAIAEHIGGSVEQFCMDMSTKARELGLKDTNFETPNGLDSDGHYTTAKELAILGAYALRNKTFVQIVNTKTYTFSELLKGGSHTVNNKNAFLTMYDGAIGIKTGFTSKASYCFVGAVRRDDRTFVSSVLSSGWYPKKTYKWADTKKLMDYGVNQFQKVAILKPCVLKERVNVSGGTKKQIQVQAQQSADTLLQGSDRLSYKLSWLDDGLTAPVKEKQLAGYLLVYLNGKLYQKVPLLTMEGCQTFDYGWCLKKVLSRFMFY